MGKNQDLEQLRLLNCDNVSGLPRIKKKVKIKKAGNSSQPDSGEFFENLISVEELAVIFGLAPQTIRNWVALGKIPHVKIGRKWFFQKGSVQEWINRKEEPQWR